MRLSESTTDKVPERLMLPARACRFLLGCSLCLIALNVSILPVLADSTDDLIDSLEAFDEGRPPPKPKKTKPVKSSPPATQSNSGSGNRGSSSSKTEVRSAPTSSSGDEFASSGTGGKGLKRVTSTPDSPVSSPSSGSSDGGHLDSGDSSVYGNDGGANESTYQQWESNNFNADRARSDGNYSEAESLYRSAISTAESMSYSGPRGISYYGLAKTLYSSGKKDEAAKYFEKALDIFDNSTRRRRVSYLVACIKDYVQVLRDLGRNAEAQQQESRLPASMR